MNDDNTKGPGQSLPGPRRYLVGERATGTAPRSGLRVLTEPPTIFQPKKRDGSPDGPERIHFAGASEIAFHPKRGRVEEWRRDGRPTIAREFPSAWDAPLSEHDAAVARARDALKAAEAARLEFLETVAPHAVLLKVDDLRAERIAWEQGDEALRQKEARKAELAKSQGFLNKLNGMMGDFVGKAARR